MSSNTRQDHKDEGNKDECKKPDFEGPKFLWDEYKYRHELIWKYVFQITASVVVVSSIPYTETAIKAGKVLGWVLVAPPLLGVLLTVYAMLRMYRELKILDRIRTKHRENHYKLFEICYSPKACPPKMPVESQAGEEKSNLRKCQPERSTFRRDVLVYLGILAIIGVANAIFIFWCWAPNLNKLQSPSTAAANDNAMTPVPTRVDR